MSCMTPLTPTPPHGSRTNMGVIEPGEKEKVSQVKEMEMPSDPACVCGLTIKFLSERVGSIQQDMGLRVNRLQFL